MLDILVAVLTNVEHFTDLDYLPLPTADETSLDDYLTQLADGSSLEQVRDMHLRY